MGPVNMVTANVFRGDVSARHARMVVVTDAVGGIAYAMQAHAPAPLLMAVGVPRGLHQGAEDGDLADVRTDAREEAVALTGLVGDPRPVAEEVPDGVHSGSGVGRTRFAGSSIVLRSPSGSVTRKFCSR